ncbi:hypothetical protein EG329_007004 [Mollisiaceae sp. DMI_Dod_QoI]|nr:hypothetical protein EG329_007004 [Helotiales sp. DMI_Dod_QoI]
MRRSRMPPQLRLGPLSRLYEKDVPASLENCHNVDSAAPLAARPLPNIKSKDSSIPLVILETIIEAYEARMFPVWPVIGTETLLQLLRTGECGDAYVAATALCAATMAQLLLPPMIVQDRTFTGQEIEKECTRARAFCDYRERPDLYAVLTSFFLHVYHAKVDNQNSALLYIQEAIVLARLLRLDDDELQCSEKDFEGLANGKVIYLLLWVTERYTICPKSIAEGFAESKDRGYAVQYGLPISLHHTVSLSSIQSHKGGTCIQGLVNLASLFVIFDSSSIPQFSRYKEFPVSKEQLVTLEGRFADTPAPLKHLSVAQQADFLATKSWMQTLLWQQAMCRGFLSSAASCDFMTFRYPAQVCQEVLRRIKLFSTEDLIPLGRDQLVKLFEIANTLADTILCNPQLAKRSTGELGPPDYLHGLYQFISPMLELDGVFDSMLRQKTAEILLRAPTRFWQLDHSTSSENEGAIENVVGIGGTVI